MVHEEVDVAAAAGIVALAIAAVQGGWWWTAVLSGASDAAAGGRGTCGRIVATSLDTQLLPHRTLLGAAGQPGGSRPPWGAAALAPSIKY